jgi:hypothetical protein
MPTARQLLERADALMRRNRRRGKQKAGDVPTLTDALGVDQGATLAPTIILPETAPSEADPISLDTLGDVPILTDVVDHHHGIVAEEESVVAEEGSVVAEEGGAVAEERSVVERPPDVSEEPRSDPSSRRKSAVESDARERETLTIPAAIEAAHGIASTSPLLDEEFILEIPPAPAEEQPVRVRSESPAMVPAGEPAMTLAPGSVAWDALAEELRMQVLQRLDLFTDTGLREQLGERVKPIVDRAGAELVETINHELGALVRGYVAEAIEREIESWRKRNE